MIRPTLTGVAPERQLDPLKEFGRLSAMADRFREMGERDVAKALYKRANALRWQDEGDR